MFPFYEYDVLVALILAPIYICTGILFHELGHAIGAWVIKWRVHMIVVAGHGYAPRKRKYVHIPGVVNQDFGGWVVATPPRERDWRENEPFFILGGIAANFLTALVAIGAARFVAEPMIASFLTGLGQVHLVFGAVNLLPFRVGGHHFSDGMQMWKWIKGRSRTELEKALAYCNACLYDGVPADEWCAADVEVIKEHAKNGDANAAGSLYGYYFQMGDFAAARPLVDRLMDEDFDSWSLYYPDFAFIVALVDEDIDRAEKILKRVDTDAHRDVFNYWRAHAIIMYGRGRQDEALGSVEKAHKLIGKSGSAFDEDDHALFDAIKNNAPLLNRTR